MNFLNYILKGGIFKTLKSLNNDKCWVNAKLKTSKIMCTTFSIYFPIIFLICCLGMTEFISNNIVILLIGLVFASIPLYCNKVLKPIVDNWYKQKI